MSKQTINIGASPNDGTGTPLRTSFDYTNQNFTELYTALGGGVGLPGATTQVIFNDGGTNLAGDAGLVYNKTTDALTVAGLVTAGSATITGDLTVDTSTLKVVAASDVVGINTASPLTGNDAGLTIGAIGTVKALNIGLQNTFARLREKDAVDGFAISTNITGANVQDDATKSSWKVRMGFANGNDNYVISRSNVGSTTFQDIYSLSTTSAVWSDGAGGTRMTLNSTGLGIGGSVTNKLTLTNTAATGAVSFLSTGTTTAYNLGQFSNTGGSLYIGVDNSTGSAISGASAYGSVIGSSNSTNLHLITNNTVRATVDTSGNLLVAGTSAYIRAGGRTQILGGSVVDINTAGNDVGIAFGGASSILPCDGFSVTTDGVANFGSASKRWNTIYAATGAINTSDQNEKQDISDLSASEKRVASSIKQLVKKYRFKDAVASKGKNARIHVGWIAQDIQNAFSSEGLDASKYGMFCSDTWEENGVEKTRLGLRYDEVLAFVVSTI